MTSDNEQTITLKFTQVQILFDMCVHSMDFGSGFLDSEDVETLRQVAEVLGVDPEVATPNEFRQNYGLPCNRCIGEHKCINHRSGNPNEVTVKTAVPTTYVISPEDKSKPLA